MAKFIVVAASLAVLGLAAMAYDLVADEETVSPRFDRPVTASSIPGRPSVTSQVDAVSVSIPIGSTRSSDGVSDARSRVEVGRSHDATVLGVRASSAMPSVLPSTPKQRHVSIEPMALGPSPGAQVSKEVFAEDVIARRAAYGKSARTIPEGEEFGN